MGPLKPHPDNPRYFTDGSGKAVFLTGSHTWNNLVDMGPGDPPPAFDYAGYLDLMRSHGHNFMRMWAWHLPNSTWDGSHSVVPHPWRRTGPDLAADGEPRFDLTAFDPAYFDRLRSRVRQARERGIYVGVMLFDGWEVEYAARRDGHPFDGPNNVNGVDLHVGDDGFLREWVGLENPSVVALQEAYVRKVVDTVGDLDNVLFEICNEAGPASREWQAHFVDFVHDYEAVKPERHPVGVTGGVGTGNGFLFGTRADWVSPEIERDDKSGQQYEDGTCTYGEAPHDRGDKVVILDTDHLWGIGGDAAWAWKSFCRGYNVIYMDKYDDRLDLLADYEPRSKTHNRGLRREMGKIRAFADRMDLAAVTPRNDLASTGYCLASPGREYLVYGPGGGEFRVNLEAGRYGCEWHDPSTGEAAEKGAFEAEGGDRSFTPPFPGDAVLYLTARGGQTG